MPDEMYCAETDVMYEPLDLNSSNISQVASKRERYWGLARAGFPRNQRLRGYLLGRPCVPGLACLAQVYLLRRWD